MDEYSEIMRYVTDMERRIEYQLRTIEVGGNLKDFTPVWTAATTNPVLGDGTLVGQYTIVGSQLRYWGALTIVSTTTLGSGAWSFSLPVACVSQSSVSFRSLGKMWINDASDSANRKLGFPSIVRFQTGISTFFHGTASTLTATSPFAWATSDTLQWDITYPI